MSVAVQHINYPTFYARPSSEGFSDVSENLWEKFKEQIREVREPITIGHPIIDASQSLKELYKECSAENWDGYGARPLSLDSVQEAYKFIQMIPSLFPMPEIFAEPSGEAGLEWFKDKRLAFVISFSGRNMITYAGIFGSNKIHGTEYFNDSIPSIVIENLRRLYS